MKSLLSIIFVLICTNASAQQHYPLHPSIGDTIDRNEKLDYSLFPTIANQDFEFATISFEKDSFYLVISKIEDNSTQKMLLSKSDLIQAQQNIEKVNRYYRYKANQAKDTNSYQSSLGEQKSRPIRMDGPMTEQMKKDARMNIRLREDARRRKEIEQGIRGQEFFIGY